MAVQRLPPCARPTDAAATAAETGATLARPRIAAAIPAHDSRDLNLCPPGGWRQRMPVARCAAAALSPRMPARRDPARTGSEDARRARSTSGPLPPTARHMRTAPCPVTKAGGHDEPCRRRLQVSGPPRLATASILPALLPRLALVRGAPRRGRVPRRRGRSA